MPPRAGSRGKSLKAKFGVRARRPRAQQASRPPPDPEKVYHQGGRFMMAEERLRFEENGVQADAAAMYAWPSMMLSAFASELFLKTILLLEGQSPSETHNLGKLYKGLHNKTKTRLAVLWDEAMRDRASSHGQLEALIGKRLPSDIRGALILCGDAFTVLRYAYEEGKETVFYIDALPRVLYQLILERKPEWGRSAAIAPD